MRNLTKEIDDLLRRGASRHTIWNLPNQGYSQDVIRRWLLAYWPQLVHVHENGDRDGSDFTNDLLLVYVDLSQAIKRLPAMEKRVVKLITDERLPLYRTAANPRENVAAEMWMSNGKLDEALESALRLLRKELEG